jgi:hypothetical protein
MKLHTSFATAALSAALVFGGLSVAVAHHGDFSDHTTTKAKSKAQAEQLEKRITSELNQKALMMAQAGGRNQMVGMGQNQALVGGPEANIAPAQPQAMPMAGGEYNESLEYEFFY